MILDSSVIIAAERGKFDLEGLLETYRDEPVRIAAVTASELLHGWERAPAGRHRDNRQRFVEGLLKEEKVNVANGERFGLLHLDIRFHHKHSDGTRS